MSDPRGAYVAPSIALDGFHCPHCGTYAKQTWYSVGVERFWSPPGAPARSGSGARSAPPVLSLARVDAGALSTTEPKHVREARVAAETQEARRILLQTGKVGCEARVSHAFVSACDRCNGIAVWLHDRLLWPNRGDAPPPNPDLSDDVRRDYEEAGSILDLSPRGAAALLRLAIQKLCAELGATGSKIDHQIADLVKKGLPVPVQQALDVVRVIGNEAVHPGELNLRDDRATVASLFTLVNMIAEKMITEPNAMAEMFGALPQGKRDGIKQRDGKKPRV